MAEFLQPFWTWLFDTTGTWGLLIVSAIPLLLGFAIYLLLLIIGGIFFGHAKKLRKKADRCKARGNYEKAFRYAQKLAKGTETEDWYRIAMHYLDGQGVAKDMAQAEQWLEKAAEKNHVQAQFQLGKLLFDRNGGKSVDRERLKGLKWLEKAAGRGNKKASELIEENRREADRLVAEAQELYLCDRQEKARQLYLEAAMRGHSGAQGTLGTMYTSGLTGTQDREEGLKWLLLAAESGNEQVYGKIGRLYYDSSAGIDRKDEALKWFLRDAENGDADSQFQCGCMYLRGEGTTKNTWKGTKWIEKAAQQHHEEAIKVQNELKSTT